MISVAQDPANHPFGIASLFQNWNTRLWMFVECRVDFIIKIMKEPDESPLVWRFAIFLCICPHCRFNRQAMPAQTFTLNKLRDDRPGSLTAEDIDIFRHSILTSL